MTLAEASILLPAAYLGGCILTGYYLVRLRLGVDVRSLGSGNAGARNVSRVLGPQGFFLTMAGDTSKGVAAALVPVYLGLGPLGVVSAMLAVFAGHVWPVQLAFKGGKGLAPVLGAATVLDYRIVAVALLVALVAFAAGRNLTLSGLVAVGLAPLTTWALGYGFSTVGGLSLLATLIMVTHRDNLREIVTRTARPMKGRS